MFYKNSNKRQGDSMEEWKKVSSNPNYMVSNTGKVRKINKNVDHSTRDKNGYITTDLYKGGKRTTARVHRLVAKEFVPNPENKSEVNHIDGDKHNNNASNLEWVTKKENCAHAWENGLATPSRGMLGKRNPNGGRKSKPFKIVETGEIFNTLKECEEAIDGNNRHISECLNGKQQTHRGYHFKYI